MTTTTQLSLSFTSKSGVRDLSQIQALNSAEGKGTQARVVKRPSPQRQAQLPGGPSRLAPASAAAHARHYFLRVPPRPAFLRSRRRAGPVPKGATLSENGSYYPPPLSFPPYPSLRVYQILASHVPSQHTSPEPPRSTKTGCALSLRGRGLALEVYPHPPPGSPALRPSQASSHWLLVALPSVHWLHVHKQQPLSSESSANALVNQNSGHQPAP